MSQILVDFAFICSFPLLPDWLHGLPDWLHGLPDWLHGLSDWLHGLSDHIRFYSAQRLYW